MKRALSIAGAILLLAGIASTTNAPGFNVWHLTGFEGRTQNVLCETEAACHLDAGYLTFKVTAASRAYAEFWADYGTTDGGSIGSTSKGCQQTIPSGDTAYLPRKNQADFIVDTAHTSGEWIEPAPAVMAASKSGTTLTVVSVDAGLPEVGMYLSGTNWPVCSGTTVPCYIKSVGTFDGGAGTFSVNSDCSGTIAQTVVTGRHEGRLIYDGGTPHVFRVHMDESFECHSGQIQVYRWVAKNGVVESQHAIETYIPNSNPVITHSMTALVSLTRGDYIELFYSINSTNEHYDIWHTNVDITQAD